jgi:ABC-type spermidine/putrescine transport system, permease component I
MAAAALSAAERRRPWLLLSPTLVTLSLLMIAPMIIMFVYSFYTTLGGGRDKPDFNWPIGSSSSPIPITTTSSGRRRGSPPLPRALRPHGLSRRLQHRHDPLPPQMDAAPAADRALLDQLHHPHLVLDPYPGGTGRHQRQPRWLGIISDPLPMLYNEGSVILGMIHFLLPYMILNIYVSLEGSTATCSPPLDTRLHRLPILS